MPQIWIAPREGARLPVNICIVVVFPAPFGPSSPSTSPRFSSRAMSFTATWVPKRRVSPRAVIVTAVKSSGIGVDSTVRFMLVECTEYT